MILGFEGESRSIVESAGCGIAVEPENAAEMAAAIRYMAANRDEARRMGERGHTLACEQYDRRLLAQQFATLLTELVSREQTSCAVIQDEGGSGPELEAQLRRRARHKA